MGGGGGLAGTLVGVLIFGLLSDILQLHNINSNLQLVLKGMIIVGTVLVQERNLGHLLGRWRPAIARPSPQEEAALERPNQTPQAPRENAHETA